MEMLLGELIPSKPKGYQDTSDHICAAMMADEIHKDVIRGELFKFMKLEARCAEHSQPCRKWSAKSTSYETGGKKNWKTIELIKNKMHKKQIHKDLYQIVYEVQFRNPDILKILYPLESNQKRYEAAVQKTKTMYMKNWKKAPWVIRKADETFLKNSI